MEHRRALLRGPRIAFAGTAIVHCTIAIVGGGASGTLVASALVRRPDAPNVVIVDPCDHIGRGVAYATDCAQHVLNVPAKDMSALPDVPDHFTGWLAANAEGTYTPSSFVPRSVYGDYLSAIARDARAKAAERWRHVRAQAIDVREHRDGLRISCSNATEIDADALVIASGNASPATWPNVSSAVRGSQRFFDSAWARGATAVESPDENVVLLGMGLTAVDAVLSLRHNGHRGTISMVSRRGLLPHEHRVFDAPPSIVPDARTVCELLEAVRALARDMRDPDSDWRGVIRDIRPHTNAIWNALSIEEQRRFFRHALPYWNVHRHRIAPEPAKELAALLAAGTVRMLAGRTGAIAYRDGIVRVPVTIRGSAEVVTIDAHRVINCSGPQHDFRLLANPLIQRLLANGAMIPNPLGIGVRIAENGALVDAGGVASTRLYAIGPARFGTLIETTAIPEIRVQAYELAAALQPPFFPAGERLAG